MKKVIVTGANRGIGFWLSRDLLQKNFHVTMACRSTENAEKSYQKLVQEFPKQKYNIDFMQLDVSDSNSHDTFIKKYKNKHQNCDLLVNNSGIYIKNQGFNRQIVQDTLQTNFYGTAEYTIKMLDIMSQNGKVITTASTLGRYFQVPSKDMKAHIKNQTEPQDVMKLAAEILEIYDKGDYNKSFSDNIYGVSKLLLAEFIKTLKNNKEVMGKKLQIYSFCPGYVKTDMTDYQGDLTQEEGIQTQLYLIGLQEVSQELQGKFFYQKKVVNL